ncbi:DUF3347 domain-containing protein [Pedobacter sp. P351]|uniref:DUF3347 domain-containing protein n=1 Tax=Pedobacter superstes TaxID=3133441 RepID=UPI0030AF13EF
MKALFLNLIVASLAFASCNSGENNKQTKDTVSSSENTQISTQGGSVQGILDSYLKLKNALTEDNAADAASAGNEVAKAFDQFDNASLNESQAKEYAEIHEDAKEHAEHIAANAGNLKHQREHFESLSQDVYDLVKSVGGARKLYLDYCPMYNNNKGANWISETKEIKNPYLGKEMPECGTVKEELN